MFRQRLFFGDQIDSCVTDLIKVRFIIIIRLDSLDQDSKTDLAGIIVHEQFDLAPYFCTVIGSCSEIIVFEAGIRVI